MSTVRKFEVAFRNEDLESFIPTISTSYNDGLHLSRTQLIEGTFDIPTGAKIANGIRYDGGAGNSDAWAVAYNPEYIACAWMGFDKTDDTHYLSRSVTGGSGPAKLLKQIFTEAHPGGGPSFTVPDNVVRVTLDADTLKLAYPSGSSSGTFTEYFIKGTEPQQTAFPFLTITPSFSPSPSVSPDGLYSPEPSHSETAPYGTDGTASPRASPTKKPTPRPTRMVLPSPGLFDH